MAKYDKEKLQRFVEFHGREWWKQARIIFGDKIGVMPKMEVNARLTATAGRAFYTLDKCDFSCYLLDLNPTYFIDDTIPHELAHIIAWRLYKYAGHGKPWKEIALALYGANNRCHSMGTKSQHERAR